MACTIVSEMGAPSRLIAIGVIVVDVITSAGVTVRVMPDGVAPPPVVGAGALGSELFPHPSAMTLRAVTESRAILMVRRLS